MGVDKQKIEDQVFLHQIIMDDALMLLFVFSMLSQFGLKCYFRFLPLLRYLQFETIMDEAFLMLRACCGTTYIIY